jgi:hypothetical protein
MGIVQQFTECLNAAEQELQPDESIIQFRLAQPLMNRADYIMRFKAVVAVLDASESSVVRSRCFIVNKSSNSGQVSIDNSTACESISDVT